MQKRYLILFFSLYCCVASTQTNQIKGSITSADGVLSFANVLLKNAIDSTIVKAEVSNENGQFQFSSIQNGNYFIATSYIGYEPQNTRIFQLNGDKIELEPIFLNPNNAELDAVVVTAKKPIIEVLADKTVFNVENTLGSTGTNGFELLRKAPGLIIDNNNNIILEGKSGVLIYINNKPSPLAGDDLINYLSALQASDIEAIEIITQPSSKYDAAGNAGIINIRLKKDKRLGTNGTATVGVTQGRNTRFNSSVSFNNRTRGANFFGNYSNNFGDNWSFLYLDRFQEGVRYDSETETIRSINTNNFKLGADFFLGDYHTIGAIVNANFFVRDQNALTNTPIIPLSSGEAEQLLVADNSDEFETYNVWSNFNYRFADTTGHELLVDIDYGRYGREGFSNQPNTYFDIATGAVLLERNFRMNTPIDINIVTAKVDYTQNALGGVIGFGAKYSNVRTENTFEFFNVEDNAAVLNTDRSNTFDYNENINAFYINYNKKWDKWNLQLGLRAEQTISEGNLVSTQQSAEDNVKRNYTDWFPSGGLTYTPNYKSSWALTYSRRIQRPNYNALNPFEYPLDELSSGKGNPFLQPQYTNNVKLSHTYKYRLTTSVSYSHIQDFFAKITDTVGTTRNFLISRNIANQEIINFGLSYPFEAAKWWSVYLSVNAYHASYESQDEKFVAIDQSTLSLFAQNTFSLPKGYKFEVSGWFSSPSVWGGTYLTNSLGSLNLAIQKKVLDEKLTVRLAFNDILFTSPWVADMQFGGLYIEGTGGWESRNVRLNLSYNFGNSQVKGARKRKTGLEDESKRVAN